VQIVAGVVQPSSSVLGHGHDVRIQVLTNAGALDRSKQLPDAARDLTLTSRTWVLLTEALDGGRMT
jgi:hypothetical protein